MPSVNGLPESIWSGPDIHDNNLVKSFFFLDFFSKVVKGASSHELICMKNTIKNSDYYKLYVPVVDRPWIFHLKALNWDVNQEPVAVVFELTAVYFWTVWTWFQISQKKIIPLAPTHLPRPPLKSMKIFDCEQLTRNVAESTRYK